LAGPTSHDTGGSEQTLGHLGTQQFGSTPAETESISFGGTSKNIYSDSVSGSTTAPTSSTRREGDPFYLNSAPPSGEFVSGVQTSSPEKAFASNKGATDATDTTASRFGSIRLDSGGESDEGMNERKMAKKKKKKAKQKATEFNAAPNLGLSSKIDFAGSDDEDDQELYQPKRGSVTNKPGRAKEFENLALVDLTTPLGDHEVMPKNEHYVVPDRPKVQPELKQEKAKKKKKDKKKTTKHPQPVQAATGDLLGFDTLAFDPGSVVQSPAANPSASSPAVAYPAPTSNPISNAFDDLLGLEMSMGPSVGLPNIEQQVANPIGESNEAKKAAKKKKSKKEKKSKS
jgi:hypothetical protein